MFWTFIFFTCKKNHELSLKKLIYCHLLIRRICSAAGHTSLMTGLLSRNKIILSQGVWKPICAKNK